MFRLFVLLAFTAAAFAAKEPSSAPIIVSQDGSGAFNGTDEKPILAALAQAVKQGGGEILIRPGTYVLQKGIVLDKVQHIQFRGTDTEGCVLKLAPLAFAEADADTAAGAAELRVRRLNRLQPGMLLHLDAKGDIDSFSGKPKPYVLATIKAITGNVLTLEKPLPHPVPAGTTMRDEHAPNLIEIRAGCGDILIDKLTLDGGRAEGDPPLQGHAQLCGVFAQGPYSYEKGPTGPPIEAVMIRRCIIRNCFGRGVAFYAVKDGYVLDSTIMDTNDEAVDFDHFVTKSAMQGCHVARSRVGIELNDASDCLVQHNEFRHCGIGLNLWRWCKQDGLNQRNAIRGNVFEDTQENGIQIAKDTSENLIEQNTVTNTGRNGISVSGSKQRVIRNTVTGAKLKALAVSGEGHQVEGN